MNRHQRRAAKAREISGGGGQTAEGYSRTCALMEKGLRAWFEENPRGRPHFRLPTMDGALVAVCIADIPVAANADARALVDLFCMLGRTVIAGGEPSVEQLRMVLEHVRVPYEKAPVTDFGTLAPMPWSWAPPAPVPPAVTRVPERRCECGQRLEACAMPEGERAVPKPGDATLCKICGRVYRLGPGLALEGPCDIATLPEDLQREVARVQTFLRNRKS